MQFRIKKDRAPRTPSPVTAKKETLLSPEYVSKHGDHKAIIARKRRKRKRKTQRLPEINPKIACAVALALVLLVVIVAVVISRSGKKTINTAIETEAATSTPTPTPTPEAEKDQIFAYLTSTGELQLIDMEGLAKAWVAEAGFEIRYQLTDAERYEVAQIVTAEAAGEPLAGKIAICQCILQACEDDGIRPAEAAERYLYSTRRPEPTDEALLAVTYVFDFGLMATTEPIKYFYNPDMVESDFHESQRYILTINKHRFYAEIKN
ncbi:hypothetical protein IMSAGC012_01507 [Lachnospiraceae bacterium]|nr:hypothetical protein IMSAGC012_01507 [Lachnospiraceae bacterium]